MIQPMGICLTFKRGLIIVGYKASEAQKSRQNTDSFLQIENLPLEDCDHIRILEHRFNVVPDFQQQAKQCNDWLFHV